MRTYLAAFLLSGVVAVTLTPLVRSLAIRLGAVDQPDSRRVNDRVVPRMGGLAIMVAFCLPLIALFFYDNDVALLVKENTWRVVVLLAGAGVMAAVGVVDDMRSLSAARKLVAQVVVATAAFAAGFQINAIALPLVGLLEMGVFAYPVTVIWIVGIINAVNLIDGLDGLAAGVALSACSVIAVLGLVSGNVFATLISVGLAGALLGFLVFNFNPARIFMGDAGSLSVGFILATTSLLGAKGATAVALLVPVLALGLPIMDTLLAVVRRAVERRPLLSPDKSHVHHRLVKMGLTHRRAVLILYGVSALLALAAVLTHFGKDWQVGTALLLVAGIFIGLFRATGGVTQIRSSGVPNLPECVEHIRYALPTALAEILTAKDLESLTRALDEFGDRSRTLAMRVELPGSEVDGWQWPSEATSTQSKRVLGLKLKVSRHGKYLGEIRFELHEDARAAIRQVEILLQLVADALADRLSASSTMSVVQPRVMPTEQR